MTDEERAKKIETALSAARAARHAADDALNSTNSDVYGFLSAALDSIVKAEGLIAQARYWQSTESD